MQKTRLLRLIEIIIISPSAYIQLHGKDTKIQLQPMYAYSLCGRHFAIGRSRFLDIVPNWLGLWNDKHLCDAVHNPAVSTAREYYLYQVLEWGYERERPGTEYHYLDVRSEAEAIAQRPESKLLILVPPGSQSLGELF